MKNELENWFGIRKRRRIIFSICNILFPLLIGATIYFLFVPTAHISVMLYMLLGKNLSIDHIDLSGTFITCFMADYLWAYALFFLVLLIYAQKRNDIRIVIIVCAGFEILIEFLQLTPIIDGTFDYFDIIVEIIANFMGIVVMAAYSIIVNKRGHYHDCNKHF